MKITIENIYIFVVCILVWFLLGYIGACIIRANNPKNLKSLKGSLNRKQAIGYVHIISYMRHTLWLGPIGLIKILYKTTSPYGPKLLFRFW